MDAALQSFKKQLRAAPVIGPTSRPPLNNAPTQPPQPPVPTTTTVKTAKERGDLMKIQYDVVQLLKSTDNYLPIADLERKLGISILGNADLYQALLKNTKLLFDSSTKTFRYRTPYDIRSKDDLLRVIREHYSERGMTVKELQDSWKGLLPAIQELEKDGYILTIRNKDNSPRVLFYNRIDLNTPTDEEFREIWKKTVLPHETDLPKELERAGLKTMEVFEKKTSAQASKAKGRRRGARKVKLTNTHIEGLDLTQDYVPVKKQ